MSILTRLAGLAAAACIATAAGAATTDQLTSFFRSVQMDDAGTVKTMLAAGAVSPNAIDPISGESGLLLALREGANRVIEILLAQPGLQLELKAPNGNTALMMAAFKHNPAAVRSLLAKGAIVNRPGWTALHFAAASGDDDITAILLAHAAIIDAEAPAKFTPLMIAAREGHESTVGVLLAAGADASLKNSEALTAAQIAERADKPRIAAAIAAHLAARK
ncbi:MAG: ankyrin repeat domain-containing protein [Pseudomonadota bacterium]|nr:ankyrin repeat domain-containing protein [Pseudomonadota bacterium]